MRFSQHISLVILALVASCGPVSTSQLDTGVGEETRSPEASPTVATSGKNANAPAEAPLAPKLIGFAAGSRFVVFDNGDHAIVVDTSLPENAPHHVFDVDGRPITTKEGVASEHWIQAGLSPAHLPHRLVASDKGTLLVKTADGVEAVDLLNRGALVAKVKVDASAGEIHGASISPDGTMFGVWTKSSLQLVRSEDEDTSTYALHFDAPNATSSVMTADDFTLTWNASGDVVMWSDARDARVVSRSSFESELHVSNIGPWPRIHSSTDGKTFVVSSSPDGVVEVWHLGEEKPQAHIASAFVGHTLISDDGQRVAWTEYSGDPTTTRQVSIPAIHTLDLETGVHARFASAGGCGHYEEELVAFEGDTLKTDAECSPGCPSIGHQSSFISYDFASGRVVKRWLGERHSPYNDTLSSQLSTVDDLRKKLHFERGDGQAPLVHHPKKSSLLFVDTQKGITLVTENGGHAIARLEDATGFHPSDVRFSPDGARVVGVSEDGYVAIWRSDDGRRLWSRR